VVRGGATDLSSPDDAEFIEAGRFGGIGSGGTLSTASLQNAYENGSEPEIITDIIRGAVSIQGGTGDNASSSIEILNNAGEVVGDWYAHGGISSLGTSTFATTTISDLTVGSLSGFLKATAGHIATALVDLASDITGTLDISDHTNLTVGATGIELSGDDIALTTGYNIPLNASTTNWNLFYDTPSTRITAGTGLSWAGNTLNAHSAVTLAGEDYLSLVTQQITANAINPDNLASADFGDFTCNGTNCSIDANSVALGTDTTGNYVQTIADAGNGTIAVTGSGSESANVTLDAIDLNCTDCIGTTEIADSYLLNTGDTASGDYNFDSNTLVVDSVNNKVGVGIASPSTKFQINDTTNASFAIRGLLIGDSSAQDYLNLWNYSANVMAIQSGDTGGYRTLALQPLGGNLGIGTTNPSHLLDINSADGDIELGDITTGTGGTDAGVILNGDSSILSALFTEVNGSILSAGINVPQITTRNTTYSGGIFRFDTRTGTSFGDSHAFVIKRYAEGSSSEVTAFNIDLNTGDTVLTPTAGNVGIGETAPDEKLEVNGTIHIAGDTLRIDTPKTPASASDTCTTGDMSWDTNYVYVCVGTDTWKRSALSTW
jgi:hypothetical protein